jgi:hypothetical protein
MYTPKTFAIYELSTGAITSLVGAPADELSFYTSETRGAVEAPTGIDPEKSYVLNGVLTPKPSLDAGSSLSNAGAWKADGVSELTYGPALPNPTKVTISSSSSAFIPPAPFDVTDGTLDLTTIASGEYTITLEAFPYLKKVIRVSAT